MILLPVCGKNFEQTRVNQITKHLKAEASEAESEQGARESVQINDDVLSHQRECVEVL